MTKKVIVSDPTEFQRMAMAQIGDVMKRHAILLVECRPIDRDPRSFISTFMFQGENHEIIIVPDEIYMELGSRRYENYAFLKPVSDESILEEFVCRLDRYLSGGSWEGTPERHGILWEIRSALSMLKRGNGPDLRKRK